MVALDIIGFAGAGFLLFFITRRAGSGSTFAHLFSLVWGPCILAAQFLATSIETLSGETVAVLFAAWWALLAGGLLTISRQPANAPREVAIGTRRAIGAVLLLFSLQAALTVYEMPTVNTQQSTVQNVLVLRKLDKSHGWRKCPWWLEPFRNAYFVYLPLAVMLRRRRVLSRGTFFLVILATCLLLLSHMTRAPLLACIATLWSSWTLLNRPSALRAWGGLAGGLAAFCVVFIAIQIALQHLQAHQAEGTELVEAYYGGSMRAYESIIDGSYPREPGLYSADMLNYTLHKVGLIDSYPSLVRSYGNYNTNIYTFLDAFTLDGGIFGAIFGAALIGAAGGWLFKKASRRHTPLMVACNALFAYSVAIAVANNEFIRINFLMTIILAAVVSRLVVKGRVSRPILLLFTARNLGSSKPSLRSVPSMLSGRWPRFL